MTDFDKRLIEKTQNISQWDFRDIDILMKIADSAEACNRLYEIRSELYNLVRETI